MSCATVRGVVLEFAGAAACLSIGWGLYRAWKLWRR